MGELARKEGAPKVSESPMEVFTPRPQEGYSLFDKYIFPATATVFGFVTVFCYNTFRRRPAYAGIHNYFITMTGMVLVSLYLRDSKLEARAEKDAVFRHYMSLHPEDFPPFERKRIGELFLPWHPAR